MPEKAPSTIYEICVRGNLDERWMRQFEGLTLTQQPEGTTRIRGEMDQAALHGILHRIGDLGIELISVERLENGAQDR